MADDGEAQLPPLSEAVQLCVDVAQAMSSVSRSEFNEPSVSIQDFDTDHGDNDVPDPLLTAHFQIRYYLQCAGDFVYSGGHLLDFESPMVMSPAVVARCSGEYAAAVWYLTDLTEDPMTRVTKLARLLRTGLLEWGVTKPAATNEQRELLSRLQRWSSAQNLAKAPSFHPDQILEVMNPGFGKAQYDHLSNYIHGAAAHVMLSFLGASRDNRYRYLESWITVLFLAGSGMSAAARVASLWGIDQSELQAIGTRYLDCWNAVAAVEQSTTGA